MERPPTSGMAATRLRPPRPPSQLVDRERLAGVLDRADVPLVLVSAPAGSGKSTLVATWALERAGLVAWLQLEEADADPTRFWLSVTAALEQTAPDLAHRLRPLVVGSMGTADAVVPAFVNELSTLADRIAIVLDDYHLIDDAEVHRAVERLADLCPPQLTLVLVTRADPPFRLGRMRVRGRVRELRATDLRFDAAEAGQLLLGVGTGLDSRLVEDLCERTEGWAAGLVLAGLSLDRTDDARRFVSTFRGDDGLVADYLADELLAALPEDERRRMVEAAVLHRLSGPLLDAVTGSTDAAFWLADLAARNQLVIRLDAIGEWYRYHHLFRDLLLLQARRSIPNRLPDLHRRAAAWFESSGLAAAAVDHLILAGDRVPAMGLMRLVGPDLLGTGQLRTLRTILERLSAGGDLDAICCLLSGWDRYLTGRYDEAKVLLDRTLVLLPADVDPIHTMPLRINLALGQGDVGTALLAAREVVATRDLAVQASELTTGVAVALAWAGCVDEARAALAVAIERSAAEHRSTAHAMALVAAAVLELHDADDDAARFAAERALDFAGVSGLGEYHGIAPALAIAAATGPAGAAIAGVEHAVTIARRATTLLGLVFVLTMAGDVLLREGSDRGSALLEEARRTIAGCPDPGIAGPFLDHATVRHRTPRPRSAPVLGLVEQLSERELAVLRHLPSTLSIPAIARELSVSPNTVKTQAAAVYRKLGVNSRGSAVDAARRHGLL